MPLEPPFERGGQRRDHEQEGERDHAGGDGTEVEARRAREPEVHPEHVDVERQCAEDLDVEVREHAQRSERRHPQESDEESKSQREREADQAQLERDPHTVEELAERFVDDRPPERVGDDRRHGSRRARSTPVKTSEKIATSTIRMSPTAVNGSNGVKYVRLMSCATNTMSATPMIEISVAPFSRPTNVLPSGGSAMRIACGNTTWRKVERRAKPSAVAASA